MLASAVFETNRVLRNTFLLLAISMFPTIVGAVVGVNVGMAAFVQNHPWLYLLIFLAGAFGLIFAISATATSILGVILFLVFSFFEGFAISGLIERALEMKNGAQMVIMAAGGTSIILFGCSVYAMTTKKDFSSWGGVLLGLLIGLLGVMILQMFLMLTGLSLFISVIAIVLFSAFLIFDVNRVVTGGEDNYVLAALAIYLDLINIFIHLLSILMQSSGDDD